MSNATLLSVLSLCWSNSGMVAICQHIEQLLGTGNMMLCIMPTSASMCAGLRQTVADLSVLCAYLSFFGSISLKCFMKARQHLGEEGSHRKYNYFFAV